MDKNKELIELSESFANLDKNFKELRADMVKDSPDDKTNRVMDMFYSMISNVHNRIDRLIHDQFDYQYKHEEGHLPKILGSERMNKALKVIGLDGDYHVEKKHIYASTMTASKRGFIVELKLPKK